MSPQPATTPTRLMNSIACFGPAVDALEALSHIFKTPFLGPILNTSRSLLTAIQNIKQNKNACAQLIEQTHILLLSIISLHVRSKTDGDLSPSMLKHLGNFTETLHKISTFIEAQQDKSNILHFFRHGQMSTLLKECKTGLEQALEIFRASVQDTAALNNIASMRIYTQEKHQEVLQLIESLSDTHSSDRSSYTSELYSSSYNSLTSVSMLPSEPKIFHGRETEVLEILQAFNQETTRIAILGAGGMGKTSLARTVLHHPEITARYGERRFFIACDSTATKQELVALIGAQVGLKPNKDLTTSVINHFSNGPSSLLILDNLETIWEPPESCRDVEEFLAHLTDIPQLAVIITMRGAERPAKVSWTRPFLPPLKPLTHEAAHQMFWDIADDGHDVGEVDRLLILTDNMPIVIDLIAHLVDSEGCFSVLSRWEKEKTSLISAGYDRKSNLDMSISLSLSSSRIRAIPHSPDLLSLISLLPNGLSDMELMRSKLPIDDILSCKAALLRTSLAYSDGNRRLKTLAPIREYMQQFHPPAPQLSTSLRKYFQELLEAFQPYQGRDMRSGLPEQIKLNFANIQNMLLQGLNTENPDLVKTIYCTIYFNHFSCAFHGRLHLLDRIPNLLPQPSDHRLEVYFITDCISGWQSKPVTNLATMVEQAQEHFLHFNDSNIKCYFQNTLGTYYQAHNDVVSARNCFESALSLAIPAGNIRGQAEALSSLALVKFRFGDYISAQGQAYEAQRLSHMVSDLSREAQTLWVQAMCWSALGSYTKALTACTASRALLNQCGMSGAREEFGVMASQAEIHMLKSEYIAAHNIHAEILHKLPPEQDPYRHAMASLNAADIELSMGTPKHVVVGHLDTARVLFMSMGHMMAGIMCDATLAHLKVKEGNLMEAYQLLQQCLTVAWPKAAQIGMYCLGKLGDGNQWDTSSWTSSWTTVYLIQGLKLKQSLHIYKALQFLGDIFLTEGGQDTAISLFTIALEGFTHMDVNCSRAECLLKLGDISRGKRDVLRALERWNTARPLFERSSQTKQVTELDERISKLHNALEGHTESSIKQSQLTSSVADLDIGTTYQSLETSVVGESLNDKKLVPASF